MPMSIGPPKGGNSDAAKVVHIMTGRPLKLPGESQVLGLLYVTAWLIVEDVSL